MRDDTILQTYLQLTEFFNKLPQCLKISSSSLRPALPHVYQLQYAGETLPPLIASPLMHRSSLQYHVTQILLHRHIFQRALKKSRGNPSALITERESFHSQVCTTAADKIAHIFRCYQSNYTLVSRLMHLTILSQMLTFVHSDVSQYLQCTLRLQLGLSIW